MNAARILLCLLLLTTGCNKRAEPDAYGNVEAIEVVVGAEAGGKLLQFKPQEGDRIPGGAIVGTIETTQAELETTQIQAQREASASRLQEIAQQIDSLEIQRTIAARAYERTRRLIAQQAATAQQLDQAERDFRVLGEQIEAARAQAQTIGREVAAADARVEQVRERVRKGEIHNPVSGTVLATYARAGEFVQLGQPLYKIANLDTLEVRAYVGETQLTSVRVGQPARVSVDLGEDLKTLDGQVTWVSSDAEFTPTPIQTREERADLVYAVKIRVPNPGGILKIGMPADVDFVEQAEAR